MDRIAESLRFVDEVISNVRWSDKEIDSIKKQRNNIVDKYHDSNMYLAVIGDFSSGKSTLINTIVGRNILKTGIMATTAIPTFIYGGEEREPIIHVHSAKGGLYRLNHSPECNRFMADHNLKLKDSFQEILKVITTTESVVKNIQKVDVLLPSENYPRGLCLIDTPGVNPGQTNSELHVERTKNVLKNVADSAVILFPATQAYTHSFEEFLKENAEKFMDDGVFVLTMMDRVPEEEREEVMEYVRDNLMKTMKLKDPLVLSCAAYQVGKVEYWTQDFLVFGAKLMDHLHLRREAILTKRLVELLNQLLTAMREEIDEQTATLKRDLKTLEDNAPPILKNALAGLRDSQTLKILALKMEYQDKLQNLEKIMKTLIMTNLDVKVAKINQRLDLSKYAKEELASDIATYTDKYYQLSQQYCNKGTALIKDTNLILLREMEKYYGRIQATSKIGHANVTEVGEKNEEVLKQSSQAVHENFSKLDSKNDMITGGGAAMIGFLIGGPIGLVVGGLIGLVGGDSLFIKSARKNLLEQVEKQIPTINSQITSDTLLQTNTYFEQCSTEIKNLEKEYLKAYNTIFHITMQEYYDKKATILRCIEKNEGYIKQININIENLCKIKG